MARPREFDEDTALRDAMAVFWEKGYDQTSFSDLTTRLGVNRQSLYATFGDKQALYNAALTRYYRTARENIARTLAEPRPVREVLRAIFENTACLVCDKGRGCFGANAMIERAPVDSETRATARAHTREVEAMFTRRIAAAQAAGEIPRGRDPVALARFLQGTLLGLAVAARAFRDPEELRDQIDVALGALA